MFISGSVPSQELVRIAAVVNDSVISMLDLLARIKIATVSSGLTDSPEVRQQLMQPVLRTLIEEQLKVQEAKRQGIEVSPEELHNGMQQVEQQNGLRPGELDQWLASVEIPYDFFARQIESQILWGKYVTTRLRPRVTISEEDITASHGIGLAEILGCSLSCSFQTAVRGKIFIRVSLGTDSDKLRSFDETLDGA